MWPQEYTLCWECVLLKPGKYHLFLPKSDACMSTPWSIGNVFGRPSHARAERGFLTH